jgi:hypothetical protein
VSALAEVAAAADPALRPYAVRSLPPGRFDELVEPDRAYVLEAVYEGYLLHYGSPRAFSGMDRDLRLLAGDALYALGLERLAERGDLDGVAELADLITLCAWAESEGRQDLIEGLWEASTAALSPRGGEGVRRALEGRT